MLLVGWSIGCVLFGAAFHATITSFKDRASRAVKAASRELGDG